MAENNEGPQIPQGQKLLSETDFTSGSGQKLKNVEVGELKTEAIDMIDKQNLENPTPKTDTLYMSDVYDYLAAEHAKNKKYMDKPVETPKTPGTPDNVVKVDFQNKKKV
jgi:hypothetical protein